MSGNRKRPFSELLDAGGAAYERKQICVVAEEYGTGLGEALFLHACTTVRSVGHDLPWVCVVGTDRLPSTIMTLRLT